MSWPQIGPFLAQDIIKWGQDIIKRGPLYSVLAPNWAFLAQDIIKWSQDIIKRGPFYNVLAPKWALFDPGHYKIGPGHYKKGPFL